MGPISKTGGCRVGGGRFPGNSYGGVPGKFKNTLALLADRNQIVIKENVKELRSNLVTNFGNAIQLTGNP